MKEESSSKAQVFITFRGKDIRRGFLSFLENELVKSSVKYYVDREELPGENLDILLKRINESRVALVIFSEDYLNSNWCIKELKQIKDKVGEKKIRVIPIFYYVTVEDVKYKWKIGEDAKNKDEIDKEKEEKEEKEVKEALRTIASYIGIRSDQFGNDYEFVKNIASQLQRVMAEIEENDSKIKKEEEAEAAKQDMSLMTWNNSRSEENPIETPQIDETLFGINRRLLKLEEKLNMEGKDIKIPIVGVLGMAGIGKTTIVKKLFEMRKKNFIRRMFFEDIHNSSEVYGVDSLRHRLLKKLLKSDEGITDDESVKNKLLQNKVFLVLDNLTRKEQLNSLLGDRKWIKDGSVIVLVTSDKSLIDEVVNDTYVVPGLDEKEGFDCFSHHAFGDPSKNSEEFLKLSRDFVNYAKGNPLALKVLGVDLRGRDRAHWESKLHQLKQSPSQTIQDVLNASYNGLKDEQKEAFLDVTCYFRSENHKFVKSLVETDSEIEDLANKFLIEISGGRVEMHGLLYTLGLKLASQQPKRLSKHQDIINVLKKKHGKIIAEDIRGMFFDMSEAATMVTLGADAFDELKNLRYLKLYDSVCQREGEADWKLNFNDGFNFNLEEIRYLHWLKFQQEEFPSGFNPKNLIALKLPHSKIKQLWSSVKETRNLKWVDLNHSIDLCDISGLVGAQKLERLNLEGCTELKELPEGMENMLSLIFLNLRGCTNLISLTTIKMKMKSLETLILSDCSNLEEFQVISDNLKALYLDGTKVKQLPDDIKDLNKLILLNMKNCTSLLTVPDCLGNMEALEEIILSGCSKLNSFPHLKENMRRLRVLWLDGTSIKEVPNLMQCSSSSIGQSRPLSVKNLSLLRHLCLRGNKMICSLEPHIGELYHLKCVDLKHCKELTSVPTFPPNLQCLDAHGCESLTTIGNPLAILVRTDQIHSKFIFSNCGKLDEVAKSGIISYIERKSQLMSSALNRYDLESFEACFPGCEVPSWFSHRAYESVIVLPEFQRHWSNDRIIGIAVCAVVSFTSHQEQNHRFLVKCTYEFKNKEEDSLRRFSCTVGETEMEEMKTEHVFIGYTSWLQIKKQKEELDKKKGCSNGDNDDQAYLRFEVTDGTGEEVKLSQVVKCGFNLVYEAEETDNVSWDVTADPSKSDVVMSSGQIGDSITFRSKGIQVEDEIDKFCLESTDPEMSHVVMSPEQTEDAVTSKSLGIQVQDLTDNDSLEDTDPEMSEDVVMSPGHSEESVNGGSSGMLEEMNLYQGQECVDAQRYETTVGVIKPLWIFCLMISISAGAVLVLGKENRKI